jgi:peptidoglycan/xylan/chitin deacetylase (PgdA/CDA1 family)
LNNVIIAIDDLHPEQGWGCEGDESVGYLEALNEEFGCKFTLFVPSNYHHKYPLSQYPDWVKFWLDREWVELAAHGHYHDCQSNGIGEQEFLELNFQQAQNRLIESFKEWTALDYKPKGFRMPGWGCNQESAQAVGLAFDWVAAHDQINRGINFDTRTLYGCDGINEIDQISEWAGAFMFQSHIAGDWNDNQWNESNYENFRNILSFLSTDRQLSYKTISEL